MMSVDDGLISSGDGPAVADVVVIESIPSNAAERQSKSEFPCPLVAVILADVATNDNLAFFYRF